jgi:hypothetical protein
MRFNFALSSLRATCFALAAFMLASGGARAQSDPGATLNVPLYGQQTNVWCWDASSLMIIKYFRPWSTLTECQLATQATPGQNCCASSPPVAPCVHTGWEMLSGNGFTFKTSSTALSFMDFTAEITAKRPVLYAVGWTGGGGHMLVADGWSVQAGIEYVSVNDPWPPSSATVSGGTKEQQTYDYWVGGPWYDHVTWADWYDIVDTKPTPIYTKIPKYTPYPIHTALPNHGPISIEKVPIAKESPSPYLELAQVVKLPLGPPLVTRELTVKPETTQVTSQAFAKLRLAPLDFIQRLGFTSSEEIAGAQLGTPLREYIVPADELAKFTATSAPSSLLTGGLTLFYPVLVNGELRSSVRVLARPGTQAQVIALGDTATAARLAKIPRFSALVRERSVVSIPAVRVPALGLYFVGQVSDGKLQIASIFDVPNLGLEAGRFEDAAAVFTRLAPLAAKVKGTM